GDGVVDVVIGAAGDDDGGTDRGAAYVLFLNADGSVKGEQKISEVSGGLTATLVDGGGFGASVAGVGDLDGDGLVDLVVGAAGDDDGGTGRGAAYVLFLNADGTVKGEQKISDAAGGLTAALSDGDGFGGSASGLGDVDGDGVADVVVGAAGDDDGGTDRGAAYVLFLNADGTVKGEQKISDTAGGLDGALADGDALGSATAGVGDLDDDGTVGLLLGASGRGGQGAVLVVDLAPTATATVADWSDRRSLLTAGGGLDVQVTAGGIVGRSLTYDGVDDRLIAPATDLVSGALTLSGWINATSFGTDPRVVAKADSAGSPVYELFVDDTSASTGGAVARIRLGGATFTVTGGSVTTGAWHHLATTWDGTTLSLYVDGQPVGSVVATGTLNTDATVPLTIGNLAAADRGFTGRIDEVRLSHTAASAAAVAFDYTNASNPGAVISVGGAQTAAADPWTVSGTQTRSGANAARAPEVTTTGRDAWLRATGIDEPGLEFRSWWWLSTTTGVDLAAGTRAGPVATSQYETAVTSSSGWDLATDVSGVRTQQAAPAGSPPTGSWVEVVLRTDESGNSAVVIGGSEVISSTAQGSGLLTGSAALRAGLLPSGQFWYVDDVRARKLIGAEPTVSLGPLERN
ncbi:MAG: LamG-like jellyroll fold domain-containing protein, partial [Actinomycetota bacterium]